MGDQKLSKVHLLIDDFEFVDQFTVSQWNAACHTFRDVNNDNICYRIFFLRSLSKNGCLSFLRNSNHH